MEERLQKILAKAGIASRRAAEELISQGRISVDGLVITMPGTKVDPDLHCIECDGKPIAGQEKKVYFLLNKPTGYVTTASDPQGRPIVTDLLPGVSARVFPVGRLDIDTEGALLLTNDGELAQHIQHPSHDITKTYEALVAGHPSPEQLAQLADGIELDGKKTWPAELKILKKTKENTRIRVKIHEGRKRQIRRMFEAVGHRVFELKRVAYGGLRLGNLASGAYRVLSRKDLDLIFIKEKSVK